MSTILIDLGNSRWKIAVMRGAELQDISSGVYADEGGFSAALSAGGRRARRVLLASVLSAARTARLVETVRSQSGLSVRLVSATDPMPGIRPGYRRPGQLGVDRVLAMVAARARCSGPFCVVDAGSAVTVDFVDAGGDHLGGFILPGQRLARECLLAHTAIPRDSVIESGALLGRDTPTAIALGVVNAVVGIVERFTSGRVALFPGVEVHTFVGGGDASAIEPLLPAPCTRMEHLVLSGLVVLAGHMEA